MHNLSGINHKGIKAIGDIVIYAILIFVVVLTLYPVLYVFTVSFTPISQLRSGRLMLIPESFTLIAYKFAFEQSGILPAYKITIFVTMAGTLLNLFMTSLGAYVLSKKYLPGRKLLTMFVAAQMVFNGGMIPFYIVVKSLKLTNTLWALILPWSILTFYLLIMRNFFAALPESLSESAKIDGCSEFRTMWNIIFPISKPIFATLGLFYAVWHWNEYFWSMLFINKTQLMPLQLIVRRMYESSIDMMSFDSSLPPPVETVRAAAVVITTLPILCVYPFLQKYFVKGVMVGAVKG